MLVLGVDAGNHNAKVVGAYGVDMFRTAICGWFERNVVESHGSDDMEFEIDGRKGFAGSIAVYEDEFGGGSMFGDSKAHEDTKIRILLAIYRYTKKYCPGENVISIVTGQPITSHKPNEKQSIVDMLTGTHEYTVNGELQRITIDKVGIAPEGSGAFWSNPTSGTIRIIDVGSGTVNAATVIDKRHINNASGTFNFGMETVNNKNDLSNVSRGVIRGTTKLKWKKVDDVYLCGGIAAELLPYIIDHYDNAKVIQPVFQVGNDMQILDPVFANAVGFYKLASGTFG